MPQYSNSTCCLRGYCEPDRGKSLCASGGASLLLGSLQRVPHCYVNLQLVFIAAHTLTKVSSWEKCRFSLISLRQTSVWNKVCLMVHAGVRAHPVQDRVEPGCCLPENARLLLGKTHNPWTRAQKTGAPHKRRKTNKQTKKNASRKELSNRLPYLGQRQII